jgi:hypothetical protein
LVDGLLILLLPELLGREIDFDLRVEDRFGTELLFLGVLFAGARSIIFGFVVVFDDRGGFLTVRGVWASGRRFVTAGFFASPGNWEVFVRDRSLWSTISFTVRGLRSGESDLSRTIGVDKVVPGRSTRLGFIGFAKVLWVSIRLFLSTIPMERRSKGRLEKVRLEFPAL